MSIFIVNQPLCRSYGRFDAALFDLICQHIPFISGRMKILFITPRTFVRLKINYPFRGELNRLFHTLACKLSI